MAIAIALIVLALGSVLFHFLSPWYFTPIASNWGAIDTTIGITFWVTGVVFVAVNVFMAVAVIRYRHRHASRAAYQPENKKLEWWLLVLTAAGHTVGSHTWSHAHLDSKKLTEAQVREEIEKGFSAVKMAIGTAPAPFFRFPALAHTQPALAYLASRNIAMFSVDVDSNDFKSTGPDQVINNVMTKLDKQGKGVILMHDLQKHTAQALPTLLRRLKAGGYKVVHMRAKEQLETLPEYDAMLVKDQKVPAVASRPISSVVQTVSQ